MDTKQEVREACELITTYWLEGADDTRDIRSKWTEVEARDGQSQEGGLDQVVVWTDHGTAENTQQILEAEAQRLGLGSLVSEVVVIESDGPELLANLA